MGLHAGPRPSTPAIDRKSNNPTAIIETAAHLGRPGSWPVSVKKPPVAPTIQIPSITATSKWPMKDRPESCFRVFTVLPMAATRLTTTIGSMGASTLNNLSNCEVSKNIKIATMPPISRVFRIILTLCTKRIKIEP